MKSKWRYVIDSVDHGLAKMSDFGVRYKGVVQRGMVLSDEYVDKL